MFLQSVDLTNKSSEDARNDPFVGRSGFYPKRRQIVRPDVRSKQFSICRGGSMKIRIMTVAGLAFMLASAVGAQTKFSGTVQCSKADPNYTVDVGDHPGHSFNLSKGSCKWGADTQINGMKITDDTGVETGESTATKATTIGTRVVTMENGDKFFATVHDSSPVKDGKPTNIEGMFTITGGTGKMKGIKGHGTYKVSPAADGTASVTVEGEYTMPAPAVPKAKPASK
jgi:hypothetical protein